MPSQPHLPSLVMTGTTRLGLARFQFSVCEPCELWLCDYSKGLDLRPYQSVLGQTLGVVGIGLVRQLSRGLV